MVYKEVVHGDAWFNNMDNGELTGVVFLDIQKAFDSVYHNILLDKLKSSRPCCEQNDNTIFFTNEKNRIADQNADAIIFHW